MSDEYFAGTSRAVRKSCAKRSLAVVSQLDQGCSTQRHDRLAACRMLVATGLMGGGGHQKPTLTYYRKVGNLVAVLQELDSQPL
jgi:hypothetical protein